MKKIEWLYIDSLDKNLTLNALKEALEHEGRNLHIVKLIQRDSMIHMQDMLRPVFDMMQWEVDACYSHIKEEFDTYLGIIFNSSFMMFDKELTTIKEIGGHDLPRLFNSTYKINSRRIFVSSPSVEGDVNVDKPFLEKMKKKYGGNCYSKVYNSIDDLKSEFKFQPYNPKFYSSLKFLDSTNMTQIGDSYSPSKKINLIH